MYTTIPVCVTIHLQLLVFAKQLRILLVRGKYIENEYYFLFLFFHTR